MLNLLPHFFLVDWHDAKPLVLYAEATLVSAILVYVYLNHGFEFWKSKNLPTKAPMANIATPMPRINISCAVPLHTLMAAVMPMMAMAAPMYFLAFILNRFKCVLKKGMEAGKLIIQTKKVLNIT